MSRQTIKIVAQVTALTDKTAEVQVILQALVAPTRLETGCLDYQLLRNSSNTTEFLFIEEWVDQKAMDIHLTTPHIQEALAKVTPLLAATPNIQKYELLA